MNEKSSGFRSRKQRLTAVGTRCADHVTLLYPQKLALTSPTGGGRSVGIVRVRTKATEFSWLITELNVLRCTVSKTSKLLDTFCPSQQLSNPMQTVADVWPDCRLETNPLSWARQSGGLLSSRICFSVAAEINSNVVDFYFFCRVCPDCCVMSVLATL